MKSAARRRSKVLKRSYRKNGDVHPDDHWIKVGLEAKRTYFREYMRAYRAAKHSSDVENYTAQKGIYGGSYDN